MPRVAIQSALYKSYRDLPMVLASLKAQTFTDWGLYLYENSCDPLEVAKEQEVLTASGIPYQWIVSDVNTGFTAHNHLLALHDAEFILVLNDDAYLAPDCIEKLVHRAEMDPMCGAVTGVVYRWTVASDQQQPFGDDTVVDTAGLEYHSLANVVDIDAGRRRASCASDLQDAKKLFGVSGAVALYRRAAFMDVSPEGLLYDPSFFMYKEDVDVAIRMLRKGYTAWFEPQALAFHRRAIKEESRGYINRIREERKRPAHLRRMMYRNQWMIYFYHCSWKLGFGDLASTFIHEMGRGVLVFVASPAVFFSAWYKILQDIPKALTRRATLRAMGLRNTSIL